VGQWNYQWRAGIFGAQVSPMKSAKILLGLLQAMVVCGAMMLLPSCASSDEDNIEVAHPKDDVSGLPWNRPKAGEDAQRFGGLPQSR